MSVVVLGSLTFTSLSPVIPLKIAMCAHFVAANNNAMIAMAAGLLNLKNRDFSENTPADVFLLMISRKALFSFLIIFMLLAAFCVLPLNAREIRVFKLQYASPFSVARICETLFAGQGTFVASPQINALVVNADDKELFHEIEKLLAALDRRPATLRFTVKSVGTASENLQRVKFKNGRFPGITNEKQSSTRQSERSVVALEFARARFTDDQIRVFSVPNWYGNEIAIISTSHGLSVSGHATESGSLMVQVWYAEGNGNNTESLLTELEVAAGQWVEFGGLQQGGDGHQRTAGIGVEGQLTVSRDKRQTDRRFAIRVDLIK